MKSTKTTGRQGIVAKRNHMSKTLLKVFTVRLRGEQWIKFKNTHRPQIREQRRLKAHRLQPYLARH